MIRLPELQEFSTAFASLVFEPLTVTVVMAKNVQVVNYDPIHLDSILASAVVSMALRARRGLPNTPEGYWIPLPLKAAWFSDDGLPLWFCSSLLPCCDVIDDVTYRHKRTIEGKWSCGRSVSTAMGKWKERRVPIPTMLCDRFQARLIGNAEWVGRLLEGIRFIGKNNGIGMGKVVHFEIEYSEFAERDIFCDDSLLVRNVPIAASDSVGISCPQSPTKVSWTSPYWKNPLYLDGWRVGTAISSNGDNDVI